MELATENEIAAFDRFETSAQILNMQDKQLSEFLTKRGLLGSIHHFVMTRVLVITGTSWGLCIRIEMLSRK